MQEKPQLTSSKYARVIKNKGRIMKKFILEVYLNADEFQKAFICVLIYLSTCTVSKKKKATRSQKLQHYVN